MKKAFQSSDVCGGGEEEAEGSALGVVVAVVEAFRTRHKDGVKKDDGVDVAVGGFAASAENLERGKTRGLIAADERLRFEVEVDGVKKLVVSARGEGAAMGRCPARRKPNLTVLVDTMTTMAQTMRRLEIVSMAAVFMRSEVAVFAWARIPVAKNRKNCFSSSELVKPHFKLGRRLVKAFH